MLLEDVEHGVERFAQALDVRVAEQHRLGTCGQVARGDVVDGALQSVQRLQGQVSTPALISTLPAKPTTSITATAGQWTSAPPGRRRTSG